MGGQVSRDANRIRVDGALDASNAHVLLATIYGATEKRGYLDLILDLSRCTSAFAPAVLGLIAQTAQLRESGIYTQLVPPVEASFSRLFQNANWSHLIDPRAFDPSRFKGHTQMPATQFTSPEQQQAAVERIINIILGSISGLDRQDFAAFEWSIQELTDNVLTHSESKVGGFVQVSTFQRSSRRVEFVVADAGLGIPGTLRRGHPTIASDTEALDRAIREGVTRDRSIGQGNGLFGSWQICSHCNGAFVVESGHARLVQSAVSGLHVYNERIPFGGTLVVATIDFSNPQLLQEALKFGGRKHRPIDYIETHFESETGRAIEFNVKRESASLGSRPAGTPVRTKLLNLRGMSDGQKILIDFSGIVIVSSSFADEVIGKLVKEIGLLDFMRQYELIGMGDMVRPIVERAIQQRMSV